MKVETKTELQLLTTATYTFTNVNNVLKVIKEMKLLNMTYQSLTRDGDTFTIIATKITSQEGSLPRSKKG
jgi:hypothetical protein